MIVWSESALERAGIDAKELLLSAGTTGMTPVPTTTTTSTPTVTTAETVEQTIARYLDMSQSARSARARTLLP